VSGQGKPEPTEVCVEFAVTDALVGVGRCVIGDLLEKPNYEKTTIELLVSTLAKAHKGAPKAL